MKPPPLPGQSPDEAHLVRTVGGAPAMATDVVFPLVLWSPDRGHTPIGTGFFVADGGLFLTAKHVVLEAIDSAGNPKCALVAMQIQGGTFIPRRVLRFTISNDADIALGVLAQMTSKSTGQPLENPRVRLRSTMPSTGTEVSTFAFPQTRKLSGEPEELHFRPGFFRGSILKNYPLGRDRVLLPGPCAETTLYIHGGASGGPVFGPSADVVALNSTGFDGTSIGFITPIACAMDLMVTEISLPGKSETSCSLRALSTLGYVTHAA